MLDADSQAAWNGVGRLNLGDGFCTGALVAPDLVVTAAHCFYSPATGVARSPERVHFVAGYRLGRYQGHARAASVTFHPDYAFSAETGAASIAADLALARLVSPIDGAAPFGVAPGLAAGDKVAILSYGRDRPEIPSIQSPCGVAARSGAMAVLDCDVTYGVSGAPVFLLVGGEWRIAAVISAMGEWRGAPRAFAVVLEDALGAMLAASRMGLKAGKRPPK